MQENFTFENFSQQKNHRKNSFKLPPTEFLISHPKEKIKLTYLKLIMIKKV